MIIDHTNGLHERVHNGGTHELESVFLQFFTNGITQGRAGSAMVLK